MPYWSTVPGLTAQAQQDTVDLFVLYFLRSTSTCHDTLYLVLISISARASERAYERIDLEVEAAAIGYFLAAVQSRLEG